MSEASADALDGTAYAYKPSLVGAGWTFRLGEDALEWTAGTRSGRVAFRDVRRMRMSFKPVGMQSHRFMTELWADGVPRLKVVSTSWKSLVEQERLDQPYAAFVRELHRRIAAAGGGARFEQGTNPFIYWPGLALLVAMALALALLFVRALQAHSTGGAVIIACFFGLSLWQGGNFFRRNRPGYYRPDALPDLLMPRA